MVPSEIALLRVSIALPDFTRVDAVLIMVRGPEKVLAFAVLNVAILLPFT